MGNELGPQGWEAFNALRADGNMVPEPHIALGFRFEGSDDWSRPEETLDQALHDRRRSPKVDQFPADAKLVTKFVDRTGKDCGQREIRFVQIPASPAGLRSRYVIDDRDLENLLRTVTACALQSP